jgi:hypothetical protein
MSEQPGEVNTSSEDEIETEVDTNVNVVSDVNVVNVDVEPPSIKDLEKYLSQVSNEEGYDSGDV